MTTTPRPLDLPADSSAWEPWFAHRCDEQLARARAVAADARTWATATLVVR